MNDKILFQEKQKFTQWWLWLLLLGPTFYVLYKLFGPIIGNDITNSRNISVSPVVPSENWIALLILFIILLFVFFMTMKTTIDTEKIVIQHLYFVKREWYWNEIESTEIIKYGFVGYGIRISLHHGTVYNVKGNSGLFLKFKNGKKRLVGTQKSAELEKVLSTILE